MSVALKEPKSSVISGGRRKVRSLFVDGSEMMEEFDVVTDELLLRKVRKANPLGGEAGPLDWVIEVGSEAKTFHPDRDLLRESTSNPQLVRQDTVEKHVFRIRNLPYPKDVFSITVQESTTKGCSGEIVVRTSNKKYFKKLEIPEMNRAGIALDPSHLSWEHKHNTLIIEYKKHLTIRTVEMQEKKERASMKSVREGQGGAGGDPAACKQQ